MYKQCVECKKMLPEHLVEEYPQIWKKPICPICALDMINKMRGRPPGTVFENEQSQEDLYEVHDFLGKQIIENWGGHMINPPQECKYRFSQSDGGHWVDLGKCNLTCKRNCVRFFQWRGFSKTEKNDELFMMGVRQF